MYFHKRKDWWITYPDSNRLRILDEFQSVGADLNVLGERIQHGVGQDEVILRELRQKVEGWRKVRNCDRDGLMLDRRLTLFRFNWLGSVFRKSDSLGEPSPHEGNV